MICVRIHDLRHSAATLLLSMKIDIKIIQRYLRHADLASTLIYVHDDDPELLREATEKIEKALEPALSADNIKRSERHSRTFLFRNEKIKYNSAMTRFPKL